MEYQAKLQWRWCRPLSFEDNLLDSRMVLAGASEQGPEVSRTAYHFDLIRGGPLGRLPGRQLLCQPLNENTARFLYLEQTLPSLIPQRQICLPSAPSPLQPKLPQCQVAQHRSAGVCLFISSRAAVGRCTPISEPGVRGLIGKGKRRGRRQ